MNKNQNNGRNSIIISELKNIALEMNIKAIEESIADSESVKVGSITISKENIREVIARSIFFEDIGGKYKNQIMLDTLNLSIKFVNLEVLLGKNYRKNKKFYPAFFEFNPFMKTIFGENDEGHSFLNVYNPPAWRKREYYFQEEHSIERVIPDLYHKLLNHLTEGKKDSYERILKWLAFSLVGKNPTYLVLVGGKGVGKTILADSVLKELHGASNYMTMTNDTFKGQFNGEIDDHTFGYLDELFMQRNARDQISKLKLMNNESIRVEKKYAPAFMARNHLNLYISSNEYEGIPLEGDNRRLFIPFCTDKKLKDTELIHQVDEYKKIENISKLGRYLLGIAPTFEEVRDPYVCPIVEEKIQDASEKEWERWAVKWFSDSLPRYAKAGEVRFEKFKEDFIKENPVPGIAPPGKNRVERFLKERKNIGWLLNKLPTNTKTGASGFRVFVRDPKHLYDF